MAGHTWNFCGRYGDDPQTITIQKMPDKLNKKQQMVLRKMYSRGATEEYQGGDIGYELAQLGLCSQVGNAWNHALMWAPQVHQWMKGQNTNAATAASVKAQYDLKGK